MGAIQNLKVAVLGAGSIGCYLGGYLQQAGCQVVLIGRERIKWDLDLRGLILTHYKRKPIKIPREDLSYHTDYAPLAEADVVLVCVKSQDTLAAAEILAQHTSFNSLFVSFQNGVGNELKIEQKTGRRTLGGIVPFNVTIVNRGEFHCGTEGDLILQKSQHEHIKTLVKAFRKSGMGIKMTPDIHSYQWGKLLVNLNNALSALSGGTLKEGLSQSAYRQVLADMMEEALHICQNAGIEPKSFGRTSVKKTIKVLRLKDTLFNVAMNMIIKIDENARSSMLDDLEGGKVSEIDYLQGEVIRLAQVSNQSAPINTIIKREVDAAFKAYQSPHYSGTDLQELIQKSR